MTWSSTQSLWKKISVVAAQSAWVNIIRVQEVGVKPVQISSAQNFKILLLSALLLLLQRTHFIVAAVKKILEKKYFECHKLLLDCENQLCVMAMLHLEISKNSSAEESLRRHPKDLNLILVLSLICRVTLGNLCAIFFLAEMKIIILIAFAKHFWSKAYESITSSP